MRVRKHKQSTLRENRKNPRVLWNRIKELSGQSIKSGMEEFLKISDGRMTAMERIVGAFNLHFTNIADNLMPRTSGNCDIDLDNLKAFVQPKKTSGDLCSIPLTSTHYIARIVADISTSKACGIDNISAKIIKLHYNEIFPPFKEDCQS